MRNIKLQDILIGCIIITGLVVLLAMDVVFVIDDFSQFKSMGFGWMPTNRVGIVTGLYVQLWGALFLLSYFFREKCFLFRGIIRICENIGSPRSPKTALFTGMLAAVLGSIMLIGGLFGYYI